MTTDTSITEVQDETVIDLPPLGFRAGGRNLIAWLIAYTVIALLVFPFWIRLLVAILRGGWDSAIEQLAGGALATLFLAATIYLAGKSFSIGRRHDRIRVSDRGLKAESQGLLRTRRREWTRDQIDLIRATRIQLPVNGLLWTALEIHAGGESEVIAVQRDEAELERICNTLGERLGIQTGDNWVPGSAQHRPIPGPPKTDIELNCTGAARLEIRVPIRGLLPGFLSAVCSLGIVASLVTAFVYHRLWVKANWSLQAVPPMHVAALVLVVVLLWALRRMLRARFAPRLRIHVGEGELSFVKPGWFRTKRAAWPLNQIRRVGVQFLMISERIGYRPVLQLFVETPNGKEQLIRLDELSSGENRRREYEFYWLTDQIQRTLFA